MVETLTADPAARLRYVVRMRWLALILLVPALGCTGPSAARRPLLSKDDVIEAVKRNAATMAPCFRDATRRGELPDATYSFRLGWTITPSGVVTQPAMQGPAGLPRHVAAGVLRPGDEHLVVSLVGARISD